MAAVLIAGEAGDLLLDLFVVGRGVQQVEHAASVPHLAVELHCARGLALRGDHALPLLVYLVEKDGVIFAVLLKLFLRLEVLVALLLVSTALAQLLVILLHDCSAKTLACCPMLLLLSSHFDILWRRL